MSAIDLQTIAQRLRDARGAAGLTQAALAEAAGVSNETISRVERGAFEPSISTLVAIADALGTSVDSLLGRATLARPARGGQAIAGRLTRSVGALDSRLQVAVLRIVGILADLGDDRRANVNGGQLAAEPRRSYGPGERRKRRKPR